MVTDNLVGVLCTWRRLIEPKSSDDDRTGRNTEHKKELWCFWWGDMPKLLESFKDTLDSSEKEETWADSTDGITYIQRTLLFKALHNAVERKLCNEGWTRLGRWFIKVGDTLPSGDQMIGQESRSAAISLSFFLNGSAVCCSIEPGTPPALSRLKPPTNPEHLPMEVVTAPWGLRGWFSGQFYRSHQYPVSNLVNEWRLFYPFALPADAHDNEDEPFAVELALGGNLGALKVIYPARLVFIGGHQDEPQQIRVKPNKTKIENVVLEVARNASMDFSPNRPLPSNPSPTNQNPSATPNCNSNPDLAPTFTDRRCKVPFREKIGQKRAARWNRLNKFHNRNIDSSGGNRTDAMFDEMINAQNLGNVSNGGGGDHPSSGGNTGGDSGPPTNLTSNATESPVTDTDSPQVQSAKNQLKSDDASNSQLHSIRPLSPKYVKESVEIWSGLKLPIDSTGSNLKSDKCRPKLQLDGLDPEVVYRTANDTTPLEKILFPEFRPRKRLKKMHVTEESEPIGVKRLPDELRFGEDSHDHVGHDLTNNIDIKPEPDMDWDSDRIIKPIVLGGGESKGKRELSLYLYCLSLCV